MAPREYACSGKYDRPHSGQWESMRKIPRKRRPRPQLGQRQCAARRMICDSGGRVTIFGAVVEASRSAAEPRSNSTSAAKRLRKYAYPALQGLKPLKKTETLCRAYPSFVRIKRHDPQNLRLFPQPVKPVLLTCAALTPCLHAMERAKGHT